MQVKLLFSILFISFWTLSAGQNILFGRVTDANSKEPLVGATILVANTEYGTISGNDGSFNLVSKFQDHEIVVSYVGYITRSMVIDKGPIEIGLYPDVTNLNSVTIISKEDKRWRRDFRRFQRDFFGPSEIAKHCEVINPWIINFTRINGTLHAQCDELLVFENHHTGYKISLMLEHFTARGERITYGGKPNFETLSGDFKKAREFAFYGSKRHFFHALTHGVLREEGFRVFKARYQSATNEFEKLNEVHFDKNITEHKSRFIIKADKYFNVVYTKELDPEMESSAFTSSLQSSQNSFFTIVNDSLVVDKFGMIRNPKNFIEFGYWSNYERMAHLLPLDYFPPEYLSRITKKTSEKAITAAIPRLNGFLLSNLLVPEDKIIPGGPPRDGVPSLDEPEFTSAEMAKWKDSDIIIGVTSGGEARAYPLKILNWHEVVNDVIATTPVVITYCPLCNSSAVFESKIEGERKIFGVSGLLYNSDVMLYDRQSESLWSQLESKAISGPSSGRELSLFPSQTMTWKNWKNIYPETLVLSSETGFARDYGRDPYQVYKETNDIMFPVDHLNNDIPLKEIVLGIEIDGKSKAYPISRFPKTKGIEIDLFNDKVIELRYDKVSSTAWLNTGNDPRIKSTLLYWFAWYTFHPETEIYKP